MGQSKQLELTLSAPQPQQRLHSLKEQTRVLALEGVATIYIDGAAKGNPGLAAIGVIILQDGRTQREVAEVIGETTNNVAEYKALIVGLENALELGATRVHVFSDSQLLVRQVNGVYKVKSLRLMPLFKQVGSLIQRLESFELQHVGRAHNTQADGLANRAIRAHLERVREKRPK